MSTPTQGRILREWTREQRASWDDVGLFISEWCISESYQANPDNYTLKVSATDLHEAFCIWYARYRDRRYSISAKKFSEALNKKDIAYKRSNGSWRLGIDLTVEARMELEDHRASK